MLAAPVLAQQAASPLAQPAPSTPPPVPAATVSAEAEPPLTEADVLAIGRDQPGRMTVPVSIAGRGPYPFTIDTGAERTVVSRELARLLALPRGRDVRLTAMTGAAVVGTVRIPTLAMSSVVSRQIEAPALKGDNLGAPGLLGLDSLQGHQVSIDFDKGEMSVRRSRRRHRGGGEPVEPGEIVVTAQSLLGQLIVTEAFYRGQRIRVVIDTGAAVSMGNLALRARVIRAKEKVVPITITGVTGETMTADYTQIGAVVFGGVTFQNLPVAFADAAPFKRLGLDNKPALLLGMDALKLMRRVDIDFVNREIRVALQKV
ncbi:MAG: retroviral-like aspartic protease family protein [Sphingomonas sp.]|nr:retroviral-like aspartic protease family protein [Sphingomonas sp.]